MIGTKEMHLQMQDELMSVIAKAENGEMTTLDAFIYLEEERKQLEQTLALAKSFKEDHFDEISEYAKEYPEGYMGYEIEVRNGGRIFNFKNIPEWQSYNKALKECEERHKQAFISKEKGLLTATEDGEDIVMPEITYRKSSIILKTKK